LQVAELVAAGFPIDTTYIPLMTIPELKQCRTETPVASMQRQYTAVRMIAERVVARTVLIVAHHKIFDGQCGGAYRSPCAAAVRPLIGKGLPTLVDRTAMMRSSHYPYCALVCAVKEPDRAWSWSPSPLPPCTYLGTSSRIDRAWFNRPGIN
jgi:hypothetical protein